MTAKDPSVFIPYGEIHEVQINEKEMYAIEPLICDAIFQHDRAIADYRKKLGIPSEYPDQVELLASIQCLEGKKVILKDILEQMDCKWSEQRKAPVFSLVTRASMSTRQGKNWGFSFT